MKYLNDMIPMGHCSWGSDFAFTLLFYWFLTLFFSISLHKECHYLLWYVLCALGALSAKQSTWKRWDACYIHTHTHRNTDTHTHIYNIGDCRNHHHYCYNYIMIYHYPVFSLQLVHVYSSNRWKFILKIIYLIIPTHICLW